MLQLNLAVTGGLLPDVTFSAPDSIRPWRPGVRPTPTGSSARERRLQGKVDAAYRELAGRFPDRIVTIDATGEPEAIAREVRERLRDRS